MSDPSVPREVSFREAEATDLGVLLGLLIDDSVARSRGDYTADATPEVRAAFDEITADRNNELWVGERAGTVIATLQLTMIPGLSRGGMKRAQIEAVRVRSDLRGQGIGEALMAHVSDRAEAAGCQLVQLTTDRRRVEAHRFYERLGYVASHVGMKKHLQPDDSPRPSRT